MAECERFRESLSGRLDGALDPVQERSLDQHLAHCDACREEEAALRRLREFMGVQGRRIPTTPPGWDALEARLIRQPRRRFGPGLLKLAAAFVLGLCLGLLLRAPHPTGPETWAESGGSRSAGLPGLQAFLVGHSAQAADPEALASELGFELRAPAELPGGFRLKRAYRIRVGDLEAACLVYARGDQEMCLLQYPSGLPVSWPNEGLEDCRYGGMVCRRSVGREVELLQIEPEGVNLTVVARPGTLDPDHLVRQVTAN